jgi:thioredoxin reductase (NADPH)
MTQQVYDLVVIGGGPAGLSAAINGASELSEVLLIDSGVKVSEGEYKDQLGGQAKGSTSIENYPGFIDIPGNLLTMMFAEQAKRLGADIRCPEHVSSLELTTDGVHKLIRTRQGTEVLAKAVIIAAGLSYNKLDAPGVRELLGKGVMYGSPTFNPRLLGSCTVCVVGGANSAGQAVAHLAKNPNLRVKVLVRSPEGLRVGMSQYLVDRLERMANVEVLPASKVIQAHGDMRLERLIYCVGGREEHMDADHLFIYIGASPKVQWLDQSVLLDSRGFVLTGYDLPADLQPATSFATSMPGVFAVGDVRHGSVKRVAAGCGEGAACLGSVHQYLATITGGD